MQDHAYAQNEISNHPPLARDPQGSLIEVPKGTSAFRIARQTTGRPRVLASPDDPNVPIRFPISLTPEQLAETFGPDIYHVYAVDEFGKVIGHVTRIDLTREARDFRNASPQPANDVVPVAPRAGGCGPMSDLRFALETMAQMMRTNSDALRSVTDSQADWIKALAVAKGMPRNVAFPPSRLTVDDDNDDDDPDDANPDDQVDGQDDDASLATGAPTNAYDVVCKAIDKFGDFIPEALAGLTAGSASTAASKAPAPRNTNTGTEPSGDVELAKAPNWEPRELLDMKYAHEKGKAKREARAKQQEESEPQPQPRSHLSALTAMVARDPVLKKQLIAVRAQLTPEENQILMRVVMTSTPEQIQTFADDLKPLSVDEAVATCRLMVEDLTERQEQAQTQATEPE
jgi:hypothetical protein